ncbi:MAG: radical SAM family heme chaperone HemW [Deltaproteobacteria bacterium]|nr:radical SAM family heme chaperone HemW [Deltaproteobacteria bacterium]
MNTHKLGTTAPATRGAEVGAPATGSGVYIHVPYCRRRCPYCDFRIAIRRVDEGFASGVVAELRARRGELPWPAATLSLGGGTPSALPPARMVEILEAVRAEGLSEGAEVSLEANPEDVTAEVAQAWRAAGVTRVSLGVQSFDDEVLAWLGRAHRGARAREAVAAVRDAGIAQVGVDLIAGVPGEEPERIRRDVATADELGVGHVSAYLLTVEEGTPLVRLIARGARARVDDDAQADAYEHLQERLSAHGWRQYEVSNWARPGCESRHNRLYWAHQPYLGLGPGAHSMRELEDGSVRRRNNIASLDAWLVDPATAEHEDEVLLPPHALREAVAFGLRDLGRGVDVRALGARRHSDPQPVLAALAPALARGELLADDEGRVLRLSARGARFADRIARDVLAAGGDRG